MLLTTQEIAVKKDFANPWERFIFELSLSWKFIRYDIATTIMPASLFMLAAWRTQPSIEGIVFSLAKGLLYFWLYIYIFTLANQIIGIAEDLVNKPDRPLARGLITVKQAQTRWWIYTAMFLVFGLLFGVFKWALLWLFVVVGYNFAGGARHWFTKNLFMSLGVTAQLAAAWQLVTLLTPPSWAWIVLISTVMFPLVSLQDLRDVTGDRVIKRKTFPLVFGINQTRYFLFVCFMALPVTVWAVLLTYIGLTFYAFMVGIILTVTSWMIAVRIVLRRTSLADHRTYMHFSYWYCIYLASAIIIL